MRLLTDTIEASEEGNLNGLGPCAQQTTVHNPNLKTFKSIESFSSDDSSINSCSSSPTDYMIDMMQGDSNQQHSFSMLKDFYDPFQQPAFGELLNFDPLFTGMDPFFGSLSTLNQTTVNTSDLILSEQPNTLTNTPTTASNDFPFWPSYMCLYLEYSLPCDPCRPMTYNLAQMPECSPSGLSTVALDTIPKEKCPPLATLSPNAVALSAKTNERKTIECTTTIYSFGNVVLESKESQQALWVNEGKYMYNFVFVNQFFDAFMKGIRSLQSWEEVDMAINNPKYSLLKMSN